VGRGTYGEVKLVEKDGKRYAMKKLVKEDIIKVSNMSHMKNLCPPLKLYKLELICSGDFIFLEILT
jgi:hypothetical protein